MGSKLTLRDSSSGDGDSQDAAHKEIKMETFNASSGYELRFHPLLANHRAFVFPCDVVGHVDMDSLSEPMSTTTCMHAP
jgi:hypothetical protein